MTEKDQKALLCRLCFTEEGGEQDLVRERSESKPDRTMGTKADHLLRLQKNDIIPGAATIGLMEEFREFPWVQDAMLTVGRRDLILMEYLEDVVMMQRAVLKQWQDEQELHHRAMLTLAAYET